MYKYLFLLLAPLSLFGQTNATIFPALEGDALLDALVDDYKPSAGEVMSYGEARDVLFGIIDRENNYVTCIYSGHQVFLPDGEDPTTYVYQNGSPNGINTEHSFPQSMGAEFGAAKSDMHHLFPARVAVNTARGSSPFADIQDFETDWWYFENEEYSSIPSNNKDAYSEATNSHFEPREAKKGDIARAMFYFYTMYKNQADNANSNFFSSQRNRLCQWHFEDPADQAEINRTELIAVYQDDKANPFVLDCTVAARCYCEEHPACPITATEEVVERNLVTLYPNPVQEELYFDFENQTVTNFQFQLWDAMGKRVLATKISKETQSISLDTLPSGLYFYEIANTENNEVQRGKVLLTNE